MPGATGIAVALLVMRRNSTHPKTDLAYLATLSGDAVPALAKAGLPIPCRPTETAFKGWAAATWSRAQANAARKERDVCQP